MLRSKALAAGLVVVMLLAVAATGCAGQKKAAYPEKPIELVVPYAPGGGSDVLARHIADIMQKEKILPQPLNVVNKPGAGGQVGMSYVNTKKGDPYVILTFITGQVSGPKTVPGAVQASVFTPIARLALDEECIVVKSDSRYQTIEQLMEAAKKGEKAVSIGGTAVGQEDQMVTVMLEQASGVKFNYIPFDSGGEVMKALLGGHIDAAWANPNECVSQVDAGLAKVIAVAAPQRLKKWPDAPTLKEKGYNVVFEQFRGIVGPPEMPQEAVKVLAEAFKKLSESQDWQTRYIEKNALTPAYQGPEEFAAYLKEIDQLTTELLKALGLIK